MKNALLIRHDNPKRWISLLLLVVVLHLTAIAWMTGHLGISFKSQNERGSTGGSISVSLHAPPPPKTIPLAPPPEPAGRAADVEPTPAEPESVPQNSVPTPVAAIGDDPLAGMAAPGTSVAVPVKMEGLEDDVATPWTSLQASPPPSAQLSYSIQALRQGQKVFGSGHIGWRNNGGSYSVEGESTLLFFTVFKFRSEGTIDARHGIAPVLYSEKRFRKSETNTHFHRERNEVSFSASTHAYPRNGGEQDRSSVVWQLASIGRHGSQQFRPGVQFAIFVAGARDADIWHFNVVGLEEVDTALGKMKAWHLERKPREDSYEQGVDVWLAPERQWYPVRLRHTDRNGEYLDMTVSEIRTAAR